jgi:hypothetical protein
MAQEKLNYLLPKNHCQDNKICYNYTKGMKKMIKVKQMQMANMVG